MKSINDLLLSYLLPVVGVVTASFAFDSSSTSQLCHQDYALCTSAMCVPDPSDSSKAICFCDVESGASMSTVPCDSLKPSTDSHNISTIYSTFSFKQYTTGKKGMKCPEGTPWTNCLNKRCTVDPTNAKKAICVCDVMRKGEWTTLGGDCDTTTCSTGYWSGTTIKDHDEGIAFFIKALAIQESPVKWCQESQ
jgi:hypothetical protein